MNALYATGPQSGETAERELFEKAMQIGSANLAKAIYVSRTGSDPKPSRELVWYRMGLTKTTWQTGNMARENERAAVHSDRKAFAETLRVDRDPCAKCGVRGDFGCKHRAAP